MRSKAFAWLDAIHSLFLFGAAGLVAMGIYINRVVGVSTSIYPILWAAGGLFIYNLDRLIPDAADPINLPERSEFARTRKVIVAAALLLLLLVPILAENWKTLGCIILAVIVSPFYCLTAPGLSKRIKDLPVLKCSLPPVAIMITLTIPIWMEPQNWLAAFRHWPLFAAITVALLINILLFDLRDRVGDQCAGVRTLANRLQPRSFFALLGVLLIVELGLALLEKRFELMALSIYLCALVCLSGRKQSPGFYHWAVDGMLFVPFLTSF